jgi:hypothetical protein
MPCPCHAAPLPYSDSAMSFVKVRVAAGNTRTASLFCSVLLPLFTVVGMDRCEKDVIIACGLYLLSEEKTGITTCSEQDKRKENFT